MDGASRRDARAFPGSPKSESPNSATRYLQSSLGSRDAVTRMSFHISPPREDRDAWAPALPPSGAGGSSPEGALTLLGLIPNPCSGAPRPPCGSDQQCRTEGDDESTGVPRSRFFLLVPGASFRNSNHLSPHRGLCGERMGREQASWLLGVSGAVFQNLQNVS